MFRLIAFVLALPTVAAADWSPTPAAFTYDATFQRCLMEPRLPNPVAACESFLADAYVLKRAVALAYQACKGETLATCTAPFEDAGLPAIAVGIANDSLCQDFDLSELTEGATVPAEHCVALISDILLDEGLVPLDADLWCDSRSNDCFDIQNLNTNHWISTVEDMAEDEATLQVRLRQGLEACPTRAAQSAENTPGVAMGVLELDCMANLAAGLWKDRATQLQDQ